MIRRLMKMASIGLLAGVLVAQAGQMVPFKGYCYGITPRTTGSYSCVYYDQDLNLASLEGTILCDVVGNGTELGFFGGRIFYNDDGLFVVLWAANGDEVMADLTMVNEAGGFAYILGGTGRFAGASGKWTNHPYEKRVPQGALFAHTFDGMISSVGSNQK